jgi:hypothetical protein
MQFSSLNYRSLFLLYGLSALILIPFGGLFAYLTIHGWNPPHVLVVCLIFGITAALLLWSWVEPRLLAVQTPLVRYVSAPSQSVEKVDSSVAIPPVLPKQTATAGRVTYAS